MVCERDSSLGLLQHLALPTYADQLDLTRIEPSSLEYAGRIRVPLLTFHGALDKTATTVEMESIQDSIMSRGGKCELIVSEYDMHGLVLHREENHSHVLSFLKRFE